MTRGFLGMTTTLCLLGLLCFLVIPESLNANPAKGSYPEDAGTTLTGEHQTVNEYFQISQMGPPGDPSFGAGNPAIAYNSQQQEFLVVWSGSHTISGENEIWGQRLDALTGVEIGNDFKISSTGAINDTDPLYDAARPDIAYNASDDEYLVVWSADHTTDEEYEIYGRRVDGATGNLLGSQIRISYAGPEGNPSFDADVPSIAYNSQDNEYVVVYQADTTAYSLVDNHDEIWAVRLSATAVLLSGEVRISETGTPGDANYRAIQPNIAYDPNQNAYLITWAGVINLIGSAPDYEIFGQRVQADLTEIGIDFRISDMGNEGEATTVYRPDAVHNAATGEYLVVWRSKDTGPMNSIYGQRLSETGEARGPNDFLINKWLLNPGALYNAAYPEVTLNTDINTYLVVWHDYRLSSGELEIWGRYVNASGTLIGDDMRLSQMGPEGNANYGAACPSVAYSDSTVSHILVTWSGDQTVDDETEIWGQMLRTPVFTFIPFVLR